MKKLLLLCLLLTGCEPANETTIRKTRFEGMNYLYTVTHDNHLFVTVVDGNHASGVIHHPSCPCLNK